MGSMLRVGQHGRSLPELLCSEAGLDPQTYFMDDDLDAEEYPDQVGARCVPHRFRGQQT